MIQHYDDDPSQGCEHDWKYVGTTTICEPEIDHYTCFRCKTFKHVKRRDDRLLDSVAKTWYTLEWPWGPWNWEAEQKRCT